MSTRVKRPEDKRSGHNNSGSASSRVKPIFFQNGITLIKDKRLIDKMFLTKELHLPFIQQGHNWFAYVTSTDDKLMTLGPKDFPRQELSAAQLMSEYKRRDCYVVVYSSKKFGPYYPLFFGMDGTTIIISDDEDEDNLSDILPCKTKGKAKEKKTDFEACSTCGSKFSIDVIDDNEATCLVRLLLSGSPDINLNRSR
ncbi:hypothetical protein OC834_006829 [Tilletia horrida]|nr:hypothetical protein OC834_006829 [Tilletia horrida]